MSGHRPFRELEEKMSPEARAEVKARVKETLTEMLLADVRKLMGLTQEEVAKRLGITQPSLSKLENQDDMHITTLRRLVEALGGELEIVIHMPGSDLRIRQFTDAS